MAGVRKEEVQMSSNAHDCCYCAGMMREDRHDFMPRVGNEIIVIKDVPALICDTCGEVEYTPEVSQEIDAIMKDFSAGRLLAKPWQRERSYSSPACGLDGMIIFC
jgi:YgiT-type zinc finger domain-containing protein